MFLSEDLKNNVCIDRKHFQVFVLSDKCSLESTCLRPLFGKLTASDDANWQQPATVIGARAASSLSVPGSDLCGCSGHEVANP